MWSVSSRSGAQSSVRALSLNQRGGSAPASSSLARPHLAGAASARRRHRAGVPCAQAAAADGVEYVEVAEITNAHGTRGEVRVRPTTDFPEERLERPGQRYLVRKGKGAAGDEVRPIKLKRGRPSISRGHEVHILKLEGINNPEEAKEIAGMSLCVRADSRPELDNSDGEFEYLVQDLVGLAVVHEDGSEIGTVVDVFSGTGTYDLLQVEIQEGEKKGGKVLIPFQREIAIDVDLEAGVLTVDPPAGLLDLVSMPKPKVKRGPKNKNKRNNDARRLKELREQKAKEAAAQASAEGPSASASESEGKAAPNEAYD